VLPISFQRLKNSSLFEEMNKFCDEHDQRSFLQRIFKRSAHAAKIAEYQHAITHALATFGVSVLAHT
jgi:hypothetical protein